MIEFIENQKISNALTASTRQYLTGKLKLPQELNHIPDDYIETGISCYDSYSFENPHYHLYANEYHYIINGHTIYKDLESDEEYHFKQGDFFVIRPKTRYIQKSKKGTKILFIKCPPGNDKIELHKTADMSIWLSSGFTTKRTDHYYDSNGPRPNRIVPAVSAAIYFDGKFLFLQRKDSGRWTLPGGTLKIGESLTECLSREVKEETGLIVQIDDIIGTYSNPNILIEYSDGEVRQEFTLVYYCSVQQIKNIEIDDESTSYQWVQPEEFKSLSLAESQKIRLMDLLDYIKNKTTSLK